MIRSILAVIAGYLAQFIGVIIFFAGATAVLGQIPNPETFQPPTWLLVSELVWSPIAALAGGFVCAWIARQRPMKHVYILMALMAVLGVVTLFTDRGLKPAWSTAAVILLGLGGTWLGGRLRLALSAPVVLPKQPV